tara:strand:- start:332 stop:520 length:189 start_codon:yes stop_codon:yes gene_type:complete
LTHTAGLNNFLVDDVRGMGKLNLKAVKDYLPLFDSLSKNDSYLALANPAGFYYSKANDFLRS